MCMVKAGTAALQTSPADACNMTSAGNVAATGMTSSFAGRQAKLTPSLQSARADCDHGEMHTSPIDFVGVN